MRHIYSLNFVKRNLPVLLYSALILLVFFDDVKKNQQPDSTLYELISMTRQLSVFHELLDHSDLSGQLRQQGSFTLFLPTDSAFESVGSEQIEEYLQDEEALYQLLSNHIHEGELRSTDFEYGRRIEMMSGRTLTVTRGNVGFEMDDAYLLQVDINASNGVLHIINQVISEEN